MAISHPPPRAYPLTAAITGISKVSIFLKTSFPFFEKAVPCSLFRVLISAISAPATKDFSPAPVIITALIFFVSMESKVLSSSSRTLEFKAFKAFGRLMVIMEIWSFSSYFIYSVFREYDKDMRRMKMNFEFIFLCKDILFILYLYINFILL